MVDDDEQVLRLVKRVLDRAGFESVTVGDGHAAHSAAAEWRPDIILLDLMLGDITGDQILAELRADFRTRLIPVVFLTVRGSLKDKVEHLLAGADDYVTKPFIPEELVARLRSVMSRSTSARELSPLTGMSGNSDILREISRRLARHDRFAVLYPDIDSFKSYNDHYGFLRGDDVIKTLATIIFEVLEENYSASHFAGHVGGDDFVILTEPSMAESIATEITKRFDAAVSCPLRAGRSRTRMDRDAGAQRQHAAHPAASSVSIGIVIAEPGTYASAAAVAARAAEVKGVAKRMPGSKWVLDRRRPPERFGS